MILTRGVLGAALPLLAAALGSGPIFREVPTAESGITWVHTNGKSSQHYLPETAGAGVAILDYDNDGWMDILFVDSGTSSFYKPEAHLPSHPLSKSTQWQICQRICPCGINLPTCMGR